MSSPTYSINIIRFIFPSFCPLLKFHTPAPQSLRRSCPYPKPDVNVASQDCTTIQCFTFLAAIMTSSSFWAKTCTTLKMSDQMESVWLSRITWQVFHKILNKKYGSPPCCMNEFYTGFSMFKISISSHMEK